MKANIIIDMKCLEYTIEESKNNLYGDYSTNIAFVLAKYLKRESFDIANILINYMRS